MPEGNLDRLLVRIPDDYKQPIKRALSRARHQWQRWWML
jgi:hypothetical protein